MAPLVHGFDPPERFVAGTVGPPGSRTFFLQARTGARVVSVALEKQQVAMLAQRIDELLDDVMSSEANQAMIPAVAPLGLDDAAPLEQPIPLTNTYFSRGIANEGRTRCTCARIE